MDSPAPRPVRRTRVVTPAPLVVVFIFCPHNPQIRKPLPSRGAWWRGAPRRFGWLRASCSFAKKSRSKAVGQQSALPPHPGPRGLRRAADCAASDPTPHHSNGRPYGGNLPSTKVPGHRGETLTSDRALSSSRSAATSDSTSPSHASVSPYAFVGGGVPRSAFWRIRPRARTPLVADSKPASATGCAEERVRAVWRSRLVPSRMPRTRHADRRSPTTARSRRAVGPADPASKRRRRHRFWPRSRRREPRTQDVVIPASRKGGRRGSHEHRPSSGLHVGPAVRLLSVGGLVEVLG